MTLGPKHRYYSLSLRKCIISRLLTSLFKLLIDIDYEHRLEPIHHDKGDHIMYHEILLNVKGGANNNYRETAAIN